MKKAYNLAMSHWKEINLHPDEPNTDLSGKNWRYAGEVTLSLALRINNYHKPEFEITRIFEDEQAARMLVNPDDIDEAIRSIRDYGSFVDNPI